MNNPRLAAHFRRLVERCGTPDDLNEILLDLRARSFGKRAIKDLGDLIAHKFGKNQGLVLEHVNGQASAAALMMHIILYTKTYHNRPISRLPLFAPDALDSTIEGLEEAAILKQTGLKRRRASAAAKSFMQKLEERDDGWLYIVRTPTPDEARVIGSLANSLYARPVYSAERLWSDFIYVVKRNGLLEENSSLDLSWFRQRLALFAAAKLMGSTLTLPRFGTTKLDHQFTNNGNEYLLEIFATFDLFSDMENLSGNKLPVGVPVFSTGVPAEACFGVVGRRLGFEELPRHGEMLSLAADWTLQRLG